tara:strand:- start:251 stop:817 length:567 start_codon:yes stop_codon:yes gene_type:complete
MAETINQYGIKMPGDKKKKKKESLLAKPKKKYKAKRYDTSALAAGQQVLTERKGRKDRGKKKYGSAEAGELSRAKAKKAMTTDKAYALPFGETFRQARKAGKDTFRWKGKQYHTKTKSELEKATGAKEKERFERAGKAKQVPVRKSATFAADAKADRVRAKRIAWMEKRKKEGKSYSKKNLAELKAQS